jgi:hypothetical protein
VEPLDALLGTGGEDVDRHGYFSPSR